MSHRIFVQPLIAPIRNGEVPWLEFSRSQFVLEEASLDVPADVGVVTPTWQVHLRRRELQLH
jgi:hypothetical protein